MHRFALLLSTFFVFSSAPAHAQLGGVRAGSTLSVFNADGVTSTSLNPAVSAFAEIGLSERTALTFDLGYLAGTWDTNRVPIFPFPPGSVSIRYATLTPTLAVKGRGRVQPRAFAGPVFAFRLLQEARFEDGSNETQTNGPYGIALGATTGVGLAAHIGDGTIRQVRLDLEGTYLQVDTDVTMASVGLRVGIAISPPKGRRYN